jgi:hypothetical protein
VVQEIRHACHGSSHKDHDRETDANNTESIWVLRNTKKAIKPRQLKLKIKRQTTTTALTQHLTSHHSQR